MDVPSRFSQSRLFTVRIWEEEVEQGQMEWRGQVTYVENGTFTYFRDWNTLIEFLMDTILGKRTREAKQ